MRRSLALQKDTVATALTIAGLARDELGEWSPPESGELSSFLDGLPRARLREDQMLSNDLQAFPGFAVVRTMQHGSAVFYGDGVTLTVVMANRHALEEQTGADLIYRNETYGSFVMVQYKAMEGAAGGARFNLPNEQLTKELARMDDLGAQLQRCEPDARLFGFRLTRNPFFLKLCPRLIFDPDSSGLIHGMYIPLDYWRRLEIDPSIEGKRQGRAVTFENAGRHFSNTTFSELVAKGWVGTTGPQSAILDPLIREIVESGRSVTIAVKSTNTRPTLGGILRAEVADAKPLISVGELLDEDSLDEE